MKEDDVIVIEGGPSSLVYCMIALSSNVGPELKRIGHRTPAELHREISPIPTKQTLQQSISFKYRTPQALHMAQSAQAEGDHCTGSLQADESTT